MDASLQAYCNLTLPVCTGRNFPSKALSGRTLFRSIILYSILFIVHVSLFTFDVFSQPVTQEWVQRFTRGSYANGLSVKLDSVGNVYVLVAASIAIDSTNGDYCVLKYNSAGALLWTAFYNSPGNLSDQPKAFAVTGAGDVYVTGLYNINFIHHITTVKFNTNGVLQWARVYDGGGPTDDAWDIAVDKFGNAIVVGDNTINNTMSYSLTIKYSPAGDSLWVKKLTELPPYSGSTKEVLDDSDNIYIVGSYGMTNADYLIFKYNPGGNFMWYVTFDSPQHYDDLGDYVGIDTNRNIFVLGTSYVPGYLLNNNLIKLNNNGIIQWSRVFTGLIGTNGECEIPGGITVTPDGSSIYYATVCANEQGNSDIVTLKYDSNGDSVWIRRYSQGQTGGVPNYGPVLKLDNTNNIYETGYTKSLSSGDDYFTIKYSPTGVQQWIATYNGPLPNSFDYGNDLIIDTSLNVFVTGISSRYNGNPILWDAATIKYSQPIGIIGNSNELPSHFKLYQNYPNPFNSSTEIIYQVPFKSLFRITVFNILGQEVKTLVDGFKEAGIYIQIINMNDLPSGIYFYRMNAGDNFRNTKKMILIK